MAETCNASICPSVMVVISTVPIGPAIISDRSRVIGPVDARVYDSTAIDRSRVTVAIGRIAICRVAVAVSRVTVAITIGGGRGGYETAQNRAADESSRE